MKEEINDSYKSNVPDRATCAAIISSCNSGAFPDRRTLQAFFLFANVIKPSSSSSSRTPLRDCWPRAVVPLFFLILLSCKPASAQTFQLLPEVDAYARIQPDIRFNFQAKETREAGDPTQAEVGPGFDFFLKPLVRLENITAFDLDDSKSRPLQLSVGFRYVPSPDKPHIERMIVAATPHFPLVADILLTDRNRADLNWEKGQLSWRYRNRVSFERRFTIRSYHPVPYVSAEAFYQSQYQKWSTTALYAGCLFPAGKHLELDPYYEHQNITGKRPNQQLNQFGLVLSLYY
jgi:hypothetical protein